MVIIFPDLIREGFVKKIIAAYLLLLTLIACSSTAQPTAVVTTIPTRIATLTPLPSSVLSNQTPAAQPTAAWNGIPVMAGAIAGEGDEEAYVFTIRTTSHQVQEYYEVELGKLGWQLSAEENTGTSLMLSFVDSDSAVLTVSILSKGEDALVLLVK